MTNRRIQLKPKKESVLLKKLFNKKNRYIVLLIGIVPFLIAIGIFASIVLREVGTLKNMATGVVETKQENIVENMGYILRDNATDYQKEIFKELKEAVEGDPRAEDIAIAELVAKNYVADFYTFSNKQGQYDVGGMYYIYDGEFTNGDHYKDNVYLKARDTYYKYLSKYMTDYGVENLPEVDNVTITKSEKTPWEFSVNEHVANKQDENGEWYDYREDHVYDAYLVTCSWTYKETSMDVSQFPKTINLLIINNGVNFTIIEASDKKIEERVKKEDDEEISDSTKTESDEDKEVSGTTENKDSKSSQGSNR